MNIFNTPRPVPLLNNKKYKSFRFQDGQWIELYGPDLGKVDGLYVTEPADVHAVGCTPVYLWEVKYIFFYLLLSSYLPSLLLLPSLQFFICYDSSPTRSGLGD